MVLALLEWWTEPWSELFMRRAFIVGGVAGLVCGVVGTFVVLRGMAFIGDAVAHSVFPGVAAAYVLGANLALGGAVAGIATAVTVSVMSQNRRLKEDTVIGVCFAAAFAAGIVLVSTQSNYTGDLASFLFGQILGISDADVWTVVVVGTLVVVALLAIRKELVAVALDRETARAVGLSPFRLDLALYLLVTLAIVISLQAVGNILVLALLVTPAASARMLTDRLSSMMVLAAAIGAGGSIVGLTLSFHHDLASGGLIVLVLTAVFLCCWVFGPRHGLVGLARSRRSTSPPQDPPPSDPPPSGASTNRSATTDGPMRGVHHAPSPVAAPAAD
ncbi:MAG: anchored repeat-type ABC transporter permease subunit [Acidimicrobiia bacterium]|nr:anchored repeat-type ABC transporter permease subunit [Acidimicrobiia bacterium]